MKLTTHKPTIQSPLRCQKGYILPMVSMFMIVLLGLSTHFFYRSTDNVVIAGSMRDSDEAKLLSESALNMLMGRFANTLDSDNDTFFDQTEAGELQTNKTNPNAFLMPYMFYVSAGAGIDQTAPSILQKIANGESNNVAAASLNSAQANPAITRMRVNDLFASNAIHPNLYSFNDNGLLINSTAANWDAETNYRKAATWIEITENPDDVDSIDIFIQSVAQVGVAKVYLQRYIGSYFANVTIGGISVLSEASNLNRL